MRLIILFTVATTAHLLWIGIKKIASKKFSRSLFVSFLLLQIGVGAFYLLWVLKQPPVVFNQLLSPALRESTISLVNATLTLPLGNYIPMLDGVYWSLAAEVLFYILYPLVCVPLITFFSPRPRSIKIAGVLLLIPFFLGLHLLSQKILLLSMLQLSICYYFVTGITLGYLYRRHPTFIQKSHQIFTKKLYLIPTILFVIAITIKLTILNSLPSSFDPLIYILWAFPLTLCLALALDHKTSLSKLLSNKFIVYIGTISYSIYLSHTLILHAQESLYAPHDLLSNLFFVLLAMTLIIGVASLLFILLEKPYFKKAHHPPTSMLDQTPVLSRFHRLGTSPAVILSGIVLLLSFAIFYAYQSHFNLFSIIRNPTQNIFVSPIVSNNQQWISMKDHPVVTLQITPTENNFQLLSLHLRHMSSPNLPPVEQLLLFRIKDSTRDNWDVTNSYNLAFIADSPEHIFGFPPYLYSKGKTYTVELSMANTSSSEYLEINTDPTFIQTVFKVDKKELLQNPSQLLNFIQNKIINVTSNPEAQRIMLLTLPFILLALFLLRINNKPPKR
jgi:peptidoglycan/LPS O-acetylase OafA/YrhL